MNVIDFLKEKSDRLAQRRTELLDILNPNMKEYVNEAMNSARNSQWFGWALEQRDFNASSAQNTSNNAWPHSNNPNAVKTLKSLTEMLDKQTFEGDWFCVDQSRINEFAKVTDDQQWIHTDPERAEKESPFRSTIAHGFLTLSLIPTLTNAVNTSNEQNSGVKMVVNMGFNHVRFPYPVKAGTNIRATKKTIKVLTKRRGIEVTEEITIHIEGIRRPACIVEAVMLLVY